MLKTVLGSIVLLLVVLSVGAAIGYKKYRMMTAATPPNIEQPEIVLFAKPEKVTFRQSTTTVGRKQRCQESLLSLSGRLRTPVRPFERNLIQRM